MPPFVQSARGLSELGLHLHAEEVICLILSDQIEFLAFSRIRVRKRMLQNIRLVRRVRIFARHDLVVRHELAVGSGGTTRCSDRRKLVIDGEVPVILQFCKVRGTVVFEIAALIIDTLQEQMIDLLHTFVKAAKIQFCTYDSRISVFVEIRSDQSRIIAVYSQVLCLFRISISHDRIVEIHHLHGDSVLSTVNGVDFCQIVMGIHRGNYGKIEILRLVDRASHDMSVLRLESRKGIASVIPSDDLRGVLTVAPAVHVNTNGISGQDLSVGDTRRQIVAILRVLQVIVIIQSAVRISVLTEIP